MRGRSDRQRFTIDGTGEGGRCSSRFGFRGLFLGYKGVIFLELLFGLLVVDGPSCFGGLFGVVCSMFLMFLTKLCFSLWAVV